MSYELRIWDPTRHASLPATADEALAMMERLSSVDDTRNAALERFGAALADRYQAEAGDAQGRTGIEAFWGSDPVAGTAACRTAVYRLALPAEPSTSRFHAAVDAAAAAGLVLFDDDNGMCFLPDGSNFPEDMRELWQAAVAELNAGPSAAAAPRPDSRTLLQQIAGELLDSVGHGNNHQ